jgi:hypothetical protein
VFHFPGRLAAAAEEEGEASLRENWAKAFLYLVSGFLLEGLFIFSSIPFGTSFPIPLFWLLTFFLGESKPAGFVSLAKSAA